VRFSNNCPIAFSPRNGRYSNLPPIHSYRNCRKLVLDNNNCYSDESSCSHHSSSCDTFPRYTRKSPLACYDLDKRNKQPHVAQGRLGILVAAVTKNILQIPQVNVLLAAQSWQNASPQTALARSRTAWFALRLSSHVVDTPTEQSRHVLLWQTLHWNSSRCP
jgi:hypothetical protein